MTKEMEDAVISRSLTILTRSSEGKGSHGNVVRRPSQLSVAEEITSGAPSPASTKRQASQASTPPQDDESPSHGDIFSGIGCHFTNIPPPRASLLIVESESESVASTATESRSSQTPEVDEKEDFLITPKADKHAWIQGPLVTPTRMSTRGCIVVQPSPPTQTNFLATPTSPPRAKRGASPPSAPRPTKRSRFEAQEALGSFQLDDDWRNPLGPRPRQVANAKHLTTELTAASLSDTVSQAPSDLETRSREQSEGDGDGDKIRRVRSLSDLESPIKIRSSSLPISHSSTQVHSDQGHIALEIEWFTEAEIEAQLSDLLASYRDFYLETYGDADNARIARQTFKAVFEDRLNAPEDEALLLQEEEEDIMDLFMTWVNEMEIPPTARTETFPDIQTCMGRVAQLGAAPALAGMDASWQFVRKITLLMDEWPPRIDDELPIVRGVASPTRLPDGAVTWDFEKVFCGV